MMLTRLFRYTLEKWKKPFFEEWKENGLWSIATSIFSFVILYFLIGPDEMKIEIMVAISLVGGTIIAQIIRFLWLFLRSPFMIIGEQDSIISSFEKIADRQSILSRLTELFSDGTNLRNRGEALMHESRVEPWWNEHLEWRNKTKTTMSLLNPNMANQWWTLGLYNPRRLFPHALNPLHAKRLQMFDAWLDRLQENIRKLEEE
jgi:hypothetical protein